LRLLNTVIDGALMLQNKHVNSLPHSILASSRGLEHGANLAQKTA